MDFQTMVVFILLWAFQLLVVLSIWVHYKQKQANNDPQKREEILELFAAANPGNKRSDIEKWFKDYYERSWWNRITEVGLYNTLVRDNYIFVFHYLRAKFN